MIKILKPGTLRKVVCNDCGALLSYDIEEDVQKGTEKLANMSGELFDKTYDYIDCPQCNFRIVLSAIPRYKKGIKNNDRIDTKRR